MDHQPTDSAVFDLHLKILNGFRSRFRDRRIVASKRDTYRTLTTVILVLLPMIAAWDYGGVLPYTQWYLGVSVLGVLLFGVLIWIEAVLRIHRKSPARFHRQYWIPALVVVLLGMMWVQTLTVPATAVKWLSPGTHQAYTEWLPASLSQEISVKQGESFNPIQPFVDSSVDAQRRHASWFDSIDPTIATHALSTARSMSEAHPLSVAPWATRRAMYGLSMFGLTVFLGTILFRSPNRTKLFLAMTGVFGAGLGFLAIADAVTNNAGEQWVTVSELSSAPFASFVNRNNAGGYLNLTLACALGFLIWQHTNMLATTRQQRGYRRTYDTGSQGRAEKAIRNAVTAAENAPIALMCVLVTVVAIILSGSRGAVLGTFAGLFSIILLRTTNSSVKTIAGISVAAFVAVVTGVLSMTDSAGNRLASLWQADFSNDGRLDHWTDALQATAGYLPMGSGLGTYRYAYLPYQKHSSQSWFHNADCVPLEWLLEGGIWFLPIAVIGMLVVARMLLQISGSNRTPHGHAIAICGIFMVSSQLVSQLFDFGILLPANLMTCALIVGAIVAACAAHQNTKTGLPLNATGDAINGDQSPTGSRIASRCRKFANGCSPLLFLLLVIAVIVVCQDAKMDALTDYQSRQIAGIDLEGLLDQAISADRGEANAEILFQRSRAWHPLDSRAALTYATALVLEDQVAAALAIVDVDRSQANETLRQSAPESRRALFHLRGITGIDPPRRGLLPGQSGDRLVRARELAIQALLACPLSDEARWRIMTLDFLDDSFVSSTDKLVRDSARLRNNAPGVLLPIAELASAYPGIETAAPIWKRLVEIRPDRVDEVWKWLSLIDQTDRLLDCVPGNLSVYADVIERLPLSREQARELQSRARQIAGDLGDNALDQHRASDWFAMGRLAMSEDNASLAQRYLRRAVDLNPTTPHWRYRLVLAAEANEDWTTAVAEIDRCLLQQPDNRRFRDKAKALNGPRRGK
tara:strand:- start:97534 stop:100464 length:2931 start_codon:yes stop_codon:yes gene_type:complete